MTEQSCIKVNELAQCQVDGGVVFTRRVMKEDDAPASRTQWEEEESIH